MPRVSLRELFILVAAASLMLLSLIYASSFWQGTVSLIVILAGIASVILSLIDRGQRRAIALGFAVAMLGYLLVVINAQKFSTTHSDINPELDPYEGLLPTSVALRYFYDGISRTSYYDATTGQLIPASQRDNLLLVQEGTGAMSGGGGFGPPPVSVPPGKRAAVYDTHPSREAFMPIGHFWWAIFFGYIGGKFALIVFDRRTPADSSTMA